MRDDRKVAVGVAVALTAAAIIAVFTAFFDFHGRLSRLEGQQQDLAEIKAAIMQLSVHRDVVPFQEIGGLALPRPVPGRPVGGAVAAFDTLRGHSIEITANQILKVFEPIVDPAALVNLVRRGVIQVNTITLRTAKGSDAGKAGARYEVVLDLENLTPSEVEFSVMSGQVFENRESSTGKQNLAAAKSEMVSLGGYASQRLVIDSHCLNRGLDPPDGQLGNITVFRVRDFDERGQNALWNIVERKLRE